MACRTSVTLSLLWFGREAYGARRAVQDAGNAGTMRSDDSDLVPSVEGTLSGCNCKTPCGASLSSYYLCDWCKVDRKCSGASWSLTRGNWDYCAYREDEDYEVQRASTKLSRLWESVMQTSGESTPTVGMIVMLQRIITLSMRTPFDNDRDIMATGRPKVIHGQGVHCKFDLSVSSKSSYTGFFAPGTHNGLIRLGSALPVGDAPFPGLAFKFMRNGMKSANFVALRMAGGDGPLNFFDGPISNHVAPPDMLLKLNKFQQASDCASKVGLSDVCQYDKSGKRVGNLVFPYEIIFDAPNGNMVPLDPSAKDKDVELLSKLSTIPSGTKLFNVYALASPTSPRVLIGELSTTSVCVTSLFGDEQVHFRHQRSEDDYKLKPQWIPAATSTGCAPSGKDKSEFECGERG